MEKTEVLACRYTGATPDCLTRVFVGHHLPDLFDEQLQESIKTGSVPVFFAGRQARKSLMISGSDLFSKRWGIFRLICKAVRAEPRALWQFVLVLRHEEPLDLLEEMIDGLRRAPSHFLDRLTVMPQEGMMTARRIFILLESGHRFSMDWQREADEILRSNFY